MYVAINKQLTIFQNYFGFVSRLYHGKFQNKFSRFECLRVQDSIVSRTKCSRELRVERACSVWHRLCNFYCVIFRTSVCWIMTYPPCCRITIFFQTHSWYAPYSEDASCIINLRMFRAVVWQGASLIWKVHCRCISYNLKVKGMW
jgi:hypothetical protein